MDQKTNQRLARLEAMKEQQAPPVEELSPSDSSSEYASAPPPSTMSEGYRQALYETSVLGNRWLRCKATERQAEFLSRFDREVIYGGSAGGGKSQALLMAALQFVDVPGYSALLFRKTYADLALPGALMDRARAWLAETPAKWNAQEKRWTFPSGATLTFGYLDNVDDHTRYQSSEFQFIGFDELTQFEESDYRYLFSRLRRLKSSHVPLRLRSATNPGGRGHDWVKQRFLVEGPSVGRIFVPAKLADNPHLDREEYVASLSELDPITRAQLLAGDWSARHGGSIFKREWFENRFVDAAPAYPAERVQSVRAWDLAATEPAPGKDPDWTVGAKLTRTANGNIYIEDIRRVRATPQAVEQLVVATAEMDGRNVRVFLEEEGGSAGKALSQRYYTLLFGYSVLAKRSTGDKVTRAMPFSSQCEAGKVFIVRGAWNGAFLDELEAFPEKKIHDDQVDACSSGLGYIKNHMQVDFPSVIPTPHHLHTAEQRAQTREPNFRRRGLFGLGESGNFSRPDRVRAFRPHDF